MTAREKLAIELPEKVSPLRIGGAEGCPDRYGYLPKLEGCEGKSRLCNVNHERCTACWDREIPEDNEKENKTMLGQITNIISEKDKEIHELTCRNQQLKRDVDALEHRLEQCEAIIRCTEAFLGTKILDI